MADKENLKKEKERILKQLSKHAERNPELKEEIEAKFEDWGDEVDDSVHEVENMEVETTIVGILLDRLEEINQKLEEN